MRKSSPHEAAPRRIGADLAKRLERFGYRITRQTGSHLRLSYPEPPEHHVTIPAHDVLRVGTLASILQAVATRHGISRDALLSKLF